MKVAHVKLYQEDTRLVPQYAGTATCGNRPSKIQKLSFVFLKKKSKPKKQFYNSISDTLRDLYATKTYDRPYDACLWKRAKRNKVRISNHLEFVASAVEINGNKSL